MPNGFKAIGLKCGLKESGRLDLGFIVSEKPASAAAMFTKNRFAAAPVVISKENLKKFSSSMRGIIVNSGGANACTGKKGIVDAIKMTQLLADKLQCKKEQVLVASTGVIGKHLDIKKIQSGVESGFGSLSENAWISFSDAICTTDTCRKIAYEEIKIGKEKIKILGACKGSGMIHPQLATMLAFIITDADISSNLLDKLLKNAIADSFNCLTVDGDTSTNDAVFILANGASNTSKIKEGDAAHKKFSAALLNICQSLAKQIARDGEGATKLVTINVSNAKTQADARIAAKYIATSNLVKSAIFGSDPNWGRIICALGNSPASYVPQKVKMYIGKILLFKNGSPTKFDEAKVSNYLKGKEIDIKVDLNIGKFSASVWTCDLTYDYIKINADYRT